MKPNPDGVYQNGKIDGIRVVVEWVNLQGGTRDIPYDIWQVKLKEWWVE